MCLGGGVVMKSISQYISQTLGEEGIIKKDEIDVCKYGIEYFIISVLEILSVLILSAFVGNFICTLIYFIAFIPLRIYSGGYHADSKIGCYLILLSVYALFSVILKYIPTSYYIMTGLVSIILTVITILALSPMMHDNKNFNDIEIAFYRKVSIIIMIAEALLIIAGIFVVPHSIFFFSFSLGQLAVSLSMLAVFVKSKMTGGETNEKN